MKKIEMQNATTNLFRMDTDQLLGLNKLTSTYEELKPGREVVIPITCSCSDQYFQANFSYTVLQNTSYSEVACGAFEGLLKSFTLKEENMSQENKLMVGTELHVPLRCASPEKLANISGVKYLVTYPFVEGDGPVTLSQKFSIYTEDVLRALRKWKREKIMGFTALSSPISCSTVRSPNKYGQTGRSSPISSCLSPGILAGLKYSLFNYSIEKLRRVKRDFNEENKIGSQVYGGMINNVEVMIKQMRFEGTSHVIDVHSKINHINIVNLEALSNIGSISALGSSEGNDKGWVTSEYLLHGSASEKVDIFAFGVVLLELISAREDIDGKLFKESIKFYWWGASEGGFLDQLRSFIDPQLEDYPLAEALCLAVLEKACVEHDPLHRPSIDDIMKVDALSVSGDAINLLLSLV
ncbi:unnamed protein product [Malus baccata var. baccata]